MLQHFFTTITQACLVAIGGCWFCFRECLSHLYVFDTVITFSSFHHRGIHPKLQKCVKHLHHAFVVSFCKCVHNLLSGCGSAFEKDFWNACLIACLLSFEPSYFSIKCLNVNTFQSFHILVSEAFKLRCLAIRFAAVFDRTSNSRFWFNFWNTTLCPPIDFLVHFFLFQLGSITFRVYLPSSVVNRFLNSIK